MASSAFSAQGTTLQISTGTGGAKTITAVAVGFPTILTSAAHGLANGDVVTVAAITGTAGTDATNGLNGKTYVVTNVTTNTFAVQANTTGLAYTSGGTATPQTFTNISNIKSFNGFGGMADEIDVTNLDSTAKEFRLGLQDFGTFSVELHVDYADAGQNALRAAQASGAQKNFKLNFPNAKVASFAGFVKGTPVSGGINDVLAGSAEIRISGAVTVA